MKKLILFLLILSCLMTAFSAIAQTTLTVTATGETQVSATIAVVTLGVTVRDQDVSLAQQTVNTRIASIREALIAFGLQEDCINTNYINIYAIYDYENDQEQIRAYSAVSSLSIKVTDIDKVGGVIDTAFAAGANTLEGISFSAGDTGEAQAESLRKAVESAKMKAEVLATASGLTIVGIDTITENSTYSYDNTYGNFSAEMAAAESDKSSGSTVVQAAKVIVSATITIVFSAE